MNAFHLSYRFAGRYFVVTALALGINVGARAASISNVFLEDFSDATLAAGLTAVNSPPISGGVSALNGSNAQETAQGYVHSLSSVLTGNNFTTSWISEMKIAPSTTIQGQNTGNQDVLFQWTGYMALRYNFGGPTHELIVTAAGGQNFAATNIAAGDHLAVVYTVNAGAANDTTVFYRNGTAIATVTGDFAGNTGDTGYVSQGGFGLEVYNGGGVHYARGYHVTLDAVAFSTFTGAFNPASDTFPLLATPAPEPSSFTLLGMAVVMIGTRLRRQTRQK